MKGDLNEIIDDAHRNIDHGVVYIALKKYDGKIATVDSNQIISHMTPEGSVQALAIIGTLMKGLSASLKQHPANIPPTATLTLFYGKTGDVVRLQVNGFKRTNMK